MMKTIIQGQRASLTQLGLATGQFSVTVTQPQQLGVVSHVLFLGLDAERKMTDMRYLVSFITPNSACRSIRMTDKNSFALDLSSLPTTINYLPLVLLTNRKNNHSLNIHVKVSLSVGLKQCVNYELDEQRVGQQSSLLLVEFYRNNMEWRINAVGQKFSYDLDALILHFGGEPEYLPIAEKNALASFMNPQVMGRVSQSSPTESSHNVSGLSDEQIQLRQLLNKIEADSPASLQSADKDQTDQYNRFGASEGQNTERSNPMNVLGTLAVIATVGYLGFNTFDNKDAVRKNYASKEECIKEWQDTSLCREDHTNSGGYYGSYGRSWFGPLVDRNNQLIDHNSRTRPLSNLEQSRGLSFNQLNTRATRSEKLSTSRSGFGRISMRSSGG